MVGRFREGRSGKLLKSLPLDLSDVRNLDSQREVGYQALLRQNL